MTVPMFNISGCESGRKIFVPMLVCLVQFGTKFTLPANVNVAMVIRNWIQHYLFRSKISRTIVGTFSRNLVPLKNAFIRKSPSHSMVFFFRRIWPFLFCLKRKRNYHFRKTFPNLNYLAPKIGNIPTFRKTIHLGTTDPSSLLKPIGTYCVI